MNFSTQPSTPEFLKQIAQREKQLRKQLKLSQRELAERSGVSFGSLKRFETTGQISLESLIKLAQVLGASDGFHQLFPQQEEVSHIEALFSDRTRK